MSINNLIIKHSYINLKLLYMISQFVCPNNCATVLQSYPLFGQREATSMKQWTLYKYYYPPCLYYDMCQNLKLMNAITKWHCKTHNKLKFLWWVKSNLLKGWYIVGYKKRYLCGVTLLITVAYDKHYGNAYYDMTIFAFIKANKDAQGFDAYYDCIWSYLVLSCHMTKAELQTAWLVQQQWWPSGAQVSIVSIRCRNGCTAVSETCNRQAR